MTVQKRSFSLDSKAAKYLEQRAKKLRRSASSVLSDLVIEAAQQDARERVLAELASGEEIPEREVQRWLKKLGAG